MTTKQKAGAYDKALEALRSKMKDFGEIIISREDIEQIFPGIVDEDENTRKEIVDFLGHCDIKAEKFEKWVRWFEKQKKPDEKLSHRPDGNTKYDMGFSEAEEYIRRRSFDVPWNDCDIFVDERFITQTVANVLAWADDHPESGTYDILKEGDWLAPNDRFAGQPARIHRTFDERCEIEMQEGEFKYHSMKRIREHYHKWTLTDAREGDVLFSPCCRLIWIYKDENNVHFGFNVNTWEIVSSALVDENSVRSGVNVNNQKNSYCVSYDGTTTYFGVNIIRCPVTVVKDTMIFIPSDACPASKEQCELLQKIMAAAGYEWDASIPKLKADELNQNRL